MNAKSKSCAILLAITPALLALAGCGERSHASLPDKDEDSQISDSGNSKQNNYSTAIPPGDNPDSLDYQDPQNNPPYRSCEEVIEDGIAPLNKGDPFYSEHLDGDGDGVACELYFRSCDEAREMGMAPLVEGDPGYRRGLDKDGDGRACEPFASYSGNNRSSLYASPPHYEYETYYSPPSSYGRSGDVWVDGYMRSDGTYVQGHHRSAPNSYHNDNWSTQGNTNPYTGKRGTKPRY